MPFRIGVISDTHISSPRRTIPPAVLRAFEDVDCILHAGDVARQEVLDELGLLAPVYAVAGNVDPPELFWRLRDRRLVELGGALIGLTHGHLAQGETTPERALSRFAGTDGLRAVVFGHSREPYNAMHGGVLLFNPGSPTERHRQPRHSYGFLTVDGGAVRGQIVYL